jgi:hypothetical protein
VEPIKQIRPDDKVVYAKLFEEYLDVIELCKELLSKK